MSNVVEIVVKGKDESRGAFTSATNNSGKLANATEKTKSKLGGLKVAAAAVAGSGLIKFLSDSTAEARESQKVNAQTAAVLKSTGGAANVTAKQVGDLATAISNKTGIDDEQIQSGENMLLTFTNVRNEVGKGNDIFNQATQVVTDMSAALGQDTKNSAIQLGKALNDPIKGVTALQRVGVTFTDQQKKQIKTLVESGNTMGAQKIILRELTKEFGGSAAAQATAGDKAKVAWKNFQEQIGTVLLPLIDKAETFISTKLIPTLSTMITWLSGHTGEVKVFAGAIGGVLTTVAAYKVIDRMKTSIEGLNMAMKANPILTIIAALVALGVWFVLTYKHSEDFRNKVNGVLSNLKHAWDNFAHAVDNVKHAWDNVYHAGENVVRFFQNAVHYITTAVLTIGIGFFKYLLDPFLTVVGAIIHGAASAFGWVPGIGGKLKRARADFDTFRRGADHALHGMQAQLNTENAKYKAQQLQRTINGLRGKTLTISGRDNASSVARKVQVAINALRNKQITIQTYVQSVILPTVQRRSASRTRGDAAGGVFTDRHYDTGGAYSQAGYGSTYMNERGGEIVRLPNGSMIYSHPDSERMMRGAGQPQHVVVEFDFTGADNALVEVFRKAIRVRGGNVQVVLGR